jgi:hypothetical protein
LDHFKNTAVQQWGFSIYEETQPIFFGLVNTMADAHILAYAERADVRGPRVEKSESRVYIREDRPSDDYDWPDAQPWRQYAEDDFVFYSNPAGDGLRKKVLKFTSEWACLSVSIFLATSTKCR